MNRQGGFGTAAPPPRHRHFHTVCLNFATGEGHPVKKSETGQQLEL
jgi:hypothetical protein